jgi:hypothetical protein
MGFAFAGHAQIQATVFTKAHGFVEIDIIRGYLTAASLTMNHFAVVWRH